MGLGHGEYLTISSCMLTPFKVERVKQLIERLREFDTEFTKATFLNIPPDLVSYEVLWEGVEDTELSSWSIRSLDRYFLSRLDMRIQQKVPAVMRVNFLDNTSYEVAVDFNFTELIDEEDEANKVYWHSKLIEEVGLAVFEQLSPLYGGMGIEQGMSGLTELLDGEWFLPADHS